MSIKPGTSLSPTPVQQKQEQVTPSVPKAPPPPPPAPPAAAPVQANPARADHVGSQIAAGTVAQRALGALLPTGLGGATAPRTDRTPAAPTTIPGFTGPVTVGGPRIDPSPAGPTTIPGFTGPVTVGGPRIDPSPAGPTTIPGFTGPVTVGGPRINPAPAGRTTIPGFTGPVTVGGQPPPSRPTQSGLPEGTYTLGGFEADAGPVSTSGSATPTSVEANGDVSAGRVKAGVGFKASSTDETTSEGGFTTQTSTGTVSFDADASVKFGNYGLGAGVAFSSTQTQTVKVPDEAWGAIESGEAPYPNQYDPFSIPVGGAVTTSSQDQTSTEFSASYGGFKATSGLKESDSVSVQVERVDENTVRVTSGPTDTLTATNGVGFSAGGVSADASVSRTLEDAQLTTVEFDVSTPEGQAAYEQYIATGVPPAPGTAGVNDVTQTQTLDYQQSSHLGLSVFGFDLSGDFEGSSANTVLTTHADGTRDQVSTVSTDQFDITARSKFPPGSDQAESVEYTLDLHGVSDQAAETLRQAYGGPGQDDGSGNLSLTFSTENLDAVQELAIQEIIAENPDADPAEVRAAVEDYDPAHPETFDAYRADPNWLAVATADSPDEVAQGIAQVISLEGPSRFVEQISVLAHDAGFRLPFGYEQPS